jgi:16S rRNA (guanine527-N7)-methyltransferase
MARLDTYAGLLCKWNPAINLVAPSTLPDVWSRHFYDNAGVFALIPEGARCLLDIGSCGGFPGAVIAVLAAERMPGLSVTCVESDQRKATFLRSVSRETGVGFEVLADRIEALPPHGADVVSARALAPLTRLLDLAVPHLAPDGICLFQKGARHAAEVEEALDRWRFALETCPSETDPDSAILKIGDPRRA